MQPTSKNSRREPVVAAIDQLERAATDAARFRGRTFREFWHWYNSQEEVIEGMAESEQELDDIQADLVEIRAMLDDAGYAVPEGMLDDLIGTPG